MLSEAEVRQFARDWIAAWNAHDLEAVISHYAAEVTLNSPVAVEILQDESGTVVGREVLRAYFQRGLEAYPYLRFELLDVLRGLRSVVLYYVNHKGTKTAEYMEFDASGKVVKVVANYSG
ncbi:MAG TPA: nuclear transport factor 2 family protein [Terracidiphilus sp.]|nr:nuclear transport factor 2 family protein [Terracidiphilus sp.]